MRVLALDTALAACSAALLDDRRVLARRFEMLAHGHAERIVPMVQEVMAEAALDWQAVDLVAVTVGPGSFTGVRVGLAAARGVALAAGRPLAGVTTPAAIAWGVPTARRARRDLVVALDARRGQLYVQAFDATLGELGPPALADRLALVAPRRATLVVGDGADAFAAFDDVEVDAAPRLPDARDVARVALARHGPGGAPLPCDYPTPLYLRSADARRPGEVAPIAIRRADPGQAALLAALHARCFAEAWSEAFIASLLASKGATGLVAFARDRDGRAGPAEGFALLRTVADEAELLSVGVVPERRRGGIAQRLLAAVIDRCRVAGVARLHLEVAEDNTAARTLYARAGFLQVGRRKGYYPRATGEAADALTLARPLT